MPGDRKNPVDGKIEVKFEDLGGEGILAGLTIAQARELILQKVPEFSGMPADAVGTIVTMDPDDDAWKQVPAEQKDSIMMKATEWGLQMYQAVSKDVPDTYVIRKSDIMLQFTRKAQP